MSKLTPPQFLDTIGACYDAIEWAAKYETLRGAYDDCENYYWLAWLVCNLNMTEEERAVWRIIERDYETDDSDKAARLKALFPYERLRDLLREKYAAYPEILETLS